MFSSDSIRSITVRAVAAVGMVVGLVALPGVGLAASDAGESSAEQSVENRSRVRGDEPIESGRAVHSPGEISLDGGVTSLYGMIWGPRVEPRIHLSRHLSASISVDGHMLFSRGLYTDGLRLDAFAPGYLASLRGQVPVGARNNWEVFFQPGIGALQWIPLASGGSGGTFEEFTPMFRGDLGTRYVFRDGTSLGGSLYGGGISLGEDYILPAVGLHLTVGYDF